MEGQEFLINSVQEKIQPSEDLAQVKHLSRTDLIEIKTFPAVLVLEEPYDYDQSIGRQDVIYNKQNCNLVIVVKSINYNALKEEDYKNTKQSLDDLTKQVIATILERVSSYDKISNVKLGHGDVFDGTISSVPVMWNVIPIEITLVN